MKIFNAKVFIDGSFVNGGIDFDEKINNIGENLYSSGDIDAKGCFVIPGLIDIHTHGAIGEDASDGNTEGLKKLSRYYASRGVTSWCPTTMTLKEDKLAKVFSSFANFSRPKNGAKIAGINMEGPFLSSEKKGSQNEEYLHKPDIEMFNRLYQASGNNIRIVSVAPEEKGALSFIKEASDCATVSIGHTVSDYNTALIAYKAGASHTTHLFNAMTGIHHRKPGVIPAAFDCGASVELITDGIHVDPSVVRMTEKLFGDHLVLISDSIRCTGMPDGYYELGGQSVTLNNGRATISGTDIIAGSCISLLDCLKSAVEFGVPFEKAVTAATITPAKVIKRDKEIGSLEIGKASDFVFLDNRYNIKAVYIDGNRI